LIIIPPPFSSSLSSLFPIYEKYTLMNIVENSIYMFFQLWTREKIEENKKIFFKISTISSSFLSSRYINWCEEGGTSNIYHRMLCSKKKKKLREQKNDGTKSNEHENWNFTLLKKLKRVVDEVSSWEHQKNVISFSSQILKKNKNEIFHLFTEFTNFRCK
jgi:hypothetical protein